MAHTYDGDPGNNPASITIPDDGDGPIQASDVNPAFEALADRTAVVLKRAIAIRHYVDTGHAEVFVNAAFTDDPNAHFEFGDTSPPCVVGDVIEVHASIMITGNAGSTGTLRISAIDDDAGTPTAAIPLVGATMTVHTIDTTPMRYHIPLLGRHTVTEAGVTRIQFQVAVTSGIIVVGAGITILGTHGRDPESV